MIKICVGNSKKKIIIMFGPFFSTLGCSRSDCESFNIELDETFEFLLFHPSSWQKLGIPIRHSGVVLGFVSFCYLFCMHCLWPYSVTDLFNIHRILIYTAGMIASLTQVICLLITIC